MEATTVSTNSSQYPLPIERRIVQHRLTVADPDRCTTRSIVPIADCLQARPQRWSNRSPRVALYSHDAMGMGHFRRNLLIAGSLVDGPKNAQSLLISGAREAAYFANQMGIDCLTLPSLCKEQNGQYVARHFHWPLADTVRLRSRVIAAAIAEFQPDLLIVDKIPQGIGNELMRTLKLLRRHAEVRCVLGLRDVLDSPEIVSQEWRTNGHDEVIREFFDEVWIYGDRRIYDTLAEYRFAEPTVSRAQFMGYLDQRVRPLHPTILRPSQPYALCLVGGGQDGFSLASAFVQAGVPDNWTGLVVTGPFMAPDLQARLRRMANANPAISIVDKLVEADFLLKDAERIVAMGGYNTVTSILAFQKPALIVPRTQPRQEQWIRAQRLSAAGLVSTLHPAELRPESIRTWLETPAVPFPYDGCVDLGGLTRIQGRLEQLARQF